MMTSLKPSATRVSCGSSSARRSPGPTRVVLINVHGLGDHRALGVRAVQEKCRVDEHGQHHLASPRAATAPEQVNQRAREGIGIVHLVLSLLGAGSKVLQVSGGGKKSGSGRGKKENREPERRGGRFIRSARYKSL